MGSLCKCYREATKKDWSKHLTSYCDCNIAPTNNCDLQATMVRVLIANITSNQRVKVSIFKPDLHNIVHPNRWLIIINFTTQKMLNYAMVFTVYKKYCVIITLDRLWSIYCTLLLFKMMNRRIPRTSETVCQISRLCKDIPL